MAKHLAQHNPQKEKDALLPLIREGLTKKQLAGLAQGSVERVLEAGNVFVLAEALAAMEEFAKSVRQNEHYLGFLREELFKHHGRFQTPSGARLELCEAGVHYDYSRNPEWRELDQEIRQLQERKKEVEEKLRRIAPGKMVVDTDTGEVMEGALKTSKSTYRITLAK